MQSAAAQLNHLVMMVLSSAGSPGHCGPDLAAQRMGRCICHSSQMRCAAPGMQGAAARSTGVQPVKPREVCACTSAAGSTSQSSRTRSSQLMLEDGLCMILKSICKQGKSCVIAEIIRLDLIVLVVK